MTARDELATHARVVLKDYGAVGTVRGEVSGEVSWGDALFVEESDCPESIADALIAAGWRKMPSREEVIDRLRAAEHAPMYDHDERDGSCRSCPWPLHMLAPEDIADAILALMDEDNE